MEVPDKEGDESKPVPPPRKRRSIKERLESVAKTSIQALQNKKPVEEELCVKKTISYICPCGDPTHLPHHHHLNKLDKKVNEKKSASVSKATSKQLVKDDKRRKNLSVISLPNYTDLKLSISKPHEELEKKSSTNSATSLPNNDSSKKLSPKKDYMARCRSFGSILPNQNGDKKLKMAKNHADIESDDSFGALEDWDLRILEHYNPKDSSLPRVRKPIKEEKEVLAGLEGMIVSEEEAKTPPKPPVRRTESLLKKITRKEAEKSQKVKGKKDKKRRPGSTTPPPSPVVEIKQEEVTKANLPEMDENGRVEHSSLLKVLEKYSIEEKMLKNEVIPYIDENGKSDTEDNVVRFDTVPQSTPKKPLQEEVITTKTVEHVKSNGVVRPIVESMPPSLVEFEKNLSHPVEDFLNGERMWVIRQQSDMVKN